jgi:hypothetical protein
MKRKFTLLWALLTVLSLQGFSQKKFTEGSIVYNILVNTNDASAKLADGFDGASNTIYIKGKLSRSELVSVFGTQSTIINGRTGNVIVLKEYGDKKYLINMSPSDWAETNKKYDNVYK